MLNPHDRRDLACLGLMVLVYGLAVAPVLHAVVEHGGGGHHHHHGHARTHSHGTHGEDTADHARRAEESSRAGHDDAGAPARDGEHKSGHEHLTGSVEHLHAVAVAWAVMKLPRVREVSWLAEAQCGPERVPGSALRPTAMPQGP
ncbi:hypothetical protein [Myxococcus sp. Y35]|uniref:hypothetical protein n=1 Tax=Pseudomyxococcus flavus TaxID=3115648 RepID=UPI003CFA4A6E